MHGTMKTKYVGVGGGDIIKMDIHQIFQLSAGLKGTVTLMWCYEFWIYMKTRLSWYVNMYWLHTEDPVT